MRRGQRLDWICRGKDGLAWSHDGISAVQYQSSLLYGCQRRAKMNQVLVRVQYEYKKVPYLSKASFRRINTGYYSKVRKWLLVLVGEKSLSLLV